MPIPTTDIGVSVARLRKARAVRRVFVVVLSALVVLGAAGAFGVREGTVRAAGGGYELELHYPRVARAGLTVPWSLVIRRPGGLGETVTVATTASYFDIFDEPEVDPQPESSTNDGTNTIWEFKAPAGGDTMVVALHSRLGANTRAEWGRRGATAVLEAGTGVVEVRYRTTVMP